jgi:hypothetical protein
MTLAASLISAAMFVYAQGQGSAVQHNCLRPLRLLPTNLLATLPLLNLPLTFTIFFRITRYIGDTHNARTLILMNTRTQILPLGASSKTMPVNPQDWRSHHRRLAVDGNVAYHWKHLSPLNPEKFASTGSRTQDLRCYRAIVSPFAYVYVSVLRSLWTQIYWRVISSDDCTDELSWCFLSATKSERLVRILKLKLTNRFSQRILILRISSLFLTQKDRYVKVTLLKWQSHISVREILLVIVAWTIRTGSYIQRSSCWYGDC